jgi:prepilin-type N-terminal cleavage/methylation domain-containing protein
MKSSWLTSKRPGMTLTELVAGVTILGVIITGALGFVHSQIRSFTRGSEELEALQNLRFSAEILRKDLLTIGSGVPANQPFIIYAGQDVIAFNADYATNRLNDPNAVYADTSLPASVVTAMTKALRLTIPRTSFAWPDTSYQVGVTNSPAEMIVMFFAPDTLTARTDDYALYRQVNAQAPELVATNLLKTGTTPFFQYYEKIVPVSGMPYAQAVPNGSLPLIHTARFHQSVADTGAFARVDKLKAARVAFDASNGRTGIAERRRSTSVLLDFPNAGIAVLSTCGDAPLLGAVGFNAAVITLPGGPAVRLRWTPASDETGGERDVQRYVVWRKLPTEGWVEPFASIPAGSANYEIIDLNVVPATTYNYAVAAQDCTPNNSVLSSTASATIP